MKQYRIVHEHEHFLIIDKMPGCLVHGNDSEGENSTLVKQLRTEFSGSSIFPVHRLDKDTSGLMIIAKDSETNSLISRAFESRDVSKTYLALIDKRPKKKQGWIRGDMVKSRNGSWKLTRSTNTPAVTHFQTAYLPGIDKRLVMLKPHTGKTHQLRVALKSLGAPIIGDKRYKGTHADRLYLHAFGLEFTLYDQVYSFSTLPREGEVFLEQEFIRGVEAFSK